MMRIKLWPILSGGRFAHRFLTSYAVLWFRGLITSRLNMWHRISREVGLLGSIPQIRTVSNLIGLSLPWIEHPTLETILLEWTAGQRIRWEGPGWSGGACSADGVRTMPPIPL